MRRTVLVTCAAALLLLACGGEKPAPAKAPPASASASGPYDASRFYVEHDKFLAADEPKTVPAAKASFLRDDDEVFGIVVRGHARAYPITMISYHHVVNDVIEGIPVAVTY